MRLRNGKQYSFQVKQTAMKLENQLTPLELVEEFSEIRTSDIDKVLVKSNDSISNSSMSSVDLKSSDSVDSNTVNIWTLTKNVLAYLILINEYGLLEDRLDPIIGELLRNQNLLSLPMQLDENDQKNLDQETRATLVDAMLKVGNYPSNKYEERVAHDLYDKCCIEWLVITRYNQIQ